jgi:hypothetical protein
MTWNSYICIVTSLYLTCSVNICVGERIFYIAFWTTINTVTLLIHITVHLRMINHTAYLFPGCCYFIRFTHLCHVRNSQPLYIGLPHGTRHQADQADDWSALCFLRWQSCVDNKRKYNNNSVVCGSHVVVMLVNLKFVSKDSKVFYLMYIPNMVCAIEIHDRSDMYILIIIVDKSSYKSFHNIT